MHLPLFIVLLLSFLVADRQSASGETTIPCEIDRGMVWVKVQTPDGASLDFLLDSGAGKSVIDLSTARRLRVELGRREVIRTVRGRRHAFEVKRWPALMGAVSMPEEMLALDLSGVSAACGRPIDGLVGIDFFRGRIVQLDYVAQKVRLLSRRGNEQPEGRRLPLRLRGDSMCVEAGIGGFEMEWMRVDTGCNSALQWVADAEMLRREGATVAVGAGIPSRMRASVQLGPYRVAEVPVGIHSRRFFAGESGLIGNGLLSRFLVTFDLDKRALFLAPR